MVVPTSTAAAAAIGADVSAPMSRIAAAAASAAAKAAAEAAKAALVSLSQQEQQRQEDPPHGYKFLNAGCYIGRATDLRWMYATLKTWTGTSAGAGDKKVVGEEQRHFHRFFLQNPESVGLDYTGLLSQSLHNTDRDTFQVANTPSTTAAAAAGPNPPHLVNTLTPDYSRPMPV